jgi:glycopeptide antibiotics resistance protein
MYYGETDLRKESGRGWIRAGWLLFYLYIAVLVYLLFFSEEYGRDHISSDYRYNLELLKEIKRFLIYRDIIGFKSVAVNILGNVAAFIPFGFMLPLLSKKYRSFIYVALLSILFSLAVEMLQMVTKVGIFDVDDILLNSLGGILGYIIYGIYHRICLKLFKRRKGG